jgi:hypothetical protein
VGIETDEIADLVPVEASPRVLQAAELVTDAGEDLVMLSTAQDEGDAAAP